MNELEIIKIAANVGGYLVMCFYLIATMRRLMETFLERLLIAIGDNTAARLLDAEAKGKLCEKIDALSKGSTKCGSSSP